METTMTRTQQYILGGAAVLLVIAGTAVGASYITANTMAPSAPVAQQTPAATQPAHPQVAQAAPRPHCNDHNIVGTVGGALAGGLIGHQFGKGTGRTVATVGGAAGGGYLGNEYIPTRGATCG